MLALVPLLFKLFRRARKSSKNDHAGLSSSPSLRLIAVFPVLVTVVALILSILCVFAGHKPGMMQNYDVFTLNTSRIGQNAVEKLERKISSFDLGDIGIDLKRRSEPIFLPATLTAPSTTLITVPAVVPRDIMDDINSLKNDASDDLDSLASAGGSKIGSATSAVRSKASSIESAAAAEVTKAIGKVETAIIELIHDAYTGIIDDLEIQGFYKVHIMANCRGTYIFENGTNVTVGESGPPTKSGPRSVDEHVDSCEQHSAVDPMQFIRILYWIGIVSVGLALVLGAVALVKGPSGKLALINVFVSLTALIFLALASLVTHGLAIAATEVINFIVGGLGVSAELGRNFLALTWATTAMVLANMLLWILVFFLVKNHGAIGGRSRPDRTSTIAMGPIPRPYGPPGSTTV